MVENQTIERLKRHVELDNEKALQNDLNNMHSADIAEIFENITPEERQKYFEYFGSAVYRLSTYLDF